MAGGMHGRGACVAGGHAWQGVCMLGGMHGKRDCHCSGRYASYWNAFLLFVCQCSSSTLIDGWDTQAVTAIVKFFRTFYTWRQWRC